MRHLLRDRRAVTSIEYALIGALIFLAIVTAVSSLGHNITNNYNNLNNSIGSHL